MTDLVTPLSAERPVTAPIPAEQVPLGYTLDELYDFFDFFDATVDDVSSYILHCTRAPSATEKLTLDVYLALLKRRRFFFWKQSAKLATTLALADRMMASSQRWREDSEGMAYMQELLQCSPSAQEEDRGRLRVLQRALRGLSFRAQRMAVLACFLRFPASRTAALLGTEKEATEREYTEIFRTLQKKLQEDVSFQNIDTEQFLRSIHARPLSEEEKRSMRHLLLERCQSGRGMSIRFALPIAIVILLTTSVTTLSLVPPISAAGTRQRIAAAEILVLTTQSEVERNLTQAERSLQNISVSYAEKELADIAINLAPYAVRKQVTQDVTIRRLLRGLEDAGRPLLSVLHDELMGMRSSPTLAH